MRLAGVPVGDEAANGEDQRLRRLERGVPEDAAREDAEPDLDLVDPRRMQRSVDEAEAPTVPPVERFPPRARVDVEVVPGRVRIVVA